MNALILSHHFIKSLGTINIFDNFCVIFLRSSIDAIKLNTNIDSWVPG